MNTTKSPPVAEPSDYWGEQDGLERERQWSKPQTVDEILSRFLGDATDEYGELNGDDTSFLKANQALAEWVRSKKPDPSEYGITDAYDVVSFQAHCDIYEQALLSDLGLEDNV